MSIKVLHINDKIEISGGVETNIQHLCQYSSDFGIESVWLGIYNHNSYEVKWFNNHKKNLKNLSLDKVLAILSEFVKLKGINIIHIHSLSNPLVISHCFKICKVVRSMRDPRMFCPGQGKFWRKSENICNKPFGLQCIFHAYSEGCVNRHPKRLFSAYNNVKFETTKGNIHYEAIFVMSQYMMHESVKVGFSMDKLILNPHFTPFVESEKLIDQADSRIKSLVYVGRLSKTKGVHYFIAAGIVLLKMGYELRFDIIGDGHDSDFFKNMIPIEYNNHFSFHGWKSHDEINSLVNFSYLMIFPSIYPEAFGISGIEAMMRGKPVIGFDVGGVSTWLKDGKTGFLVPVKDTSALVDRIIILLNDKSLYHQFSINSRKIALEEFIVEKHMTKLVETYKKVLNQ